MPNYLFVAVSFFHNENTHTHTHRLLKTPAHLLGASAFAAPEVGCVLNLKEFLPSS